MENISNNSFDNKQVATEIKFALNELNKGDVGKCYDTLRKVSNQIEDYMYGEF